ncbi:hypothetical protein cypCar_00000932 [Cyprinus carpio]|nr:hypothetical protein cypCar_00000932 [Cyprinus carpio]
MNSSGNLFWEDLKMAFFQYDLMTYDTVKHFLLRNTSIPDNSICHGLASICSGLVAAIMGTPADVVKTRVMNQPRDSNGRGLLYKSSTDCLVQSAPDEASLSALSSTLLEKDIAHKLWMEQPENIPTCLALKPYPKETVQPFLKKFKLFK